MKILEKSFKISASIIVLIVLVFLIAISIVLVVKTNNVIVLSIFGSLIAGLIVASIQLIIAWQDYKQTEKFKKLELIEIMFNRDDRVFYENLINKANSDISIMGVTAIRFFEDFADYNNNAPQNARVLLSKLEQEIQVKILLPNVSFLEENKKNDFEVVKQHISNIKKTFPQYKLETRYFEHTPSHSIFIVDDTCIVGPVFPKLESKYTPALYLKKSSPFANEYIKYFVDEWNKANAHE